MVPVSAADPADVTSQAPRTAAEWATERAKEALGKPMAPWQVEALGVALASMSDAEDRRPPEPHEKQPDPPAGYERAPRTATYQYIPPDGSPNRLLEEYGPEEALELVTREHHALADWIRAQRSRQDWDLDKPTAEMWRYIHAVKRLKSCRNQLREFVESLDRGDDCQEDWLEAQAEADALSARSMSERVRSGWPGGGMHA